MTLYGSQLEAGGQFSRYPWPSLAHCRDIIRYAEATTCSSWWKPVSIRGLRFVVWCCWYSVEGHIRCRGLIPLLSALTSNRYKSAFQDAESDFGTDKVHDVRIAFIPFVSNKFCQAFVILCTLRAHSTICWENKGCEWTFFDLENLGEWCIHPKTSSPWNSRHQLLIRPAWPDLQFFRAFRHFRLGADPVLFLHPYRLPLVD